MLLTSKEVSDRIVNGEYVLNKKNVRGSRECESIFGLFTITTTKKCLEWPAVQYANHVSFIKGSRWSRKIYGDQEHAGSYEMLQYTMSFKD